MQGTTPDFFNVFLRHFGWPIPFVVEETSLAHELTYKWDFPQSKCIFFFEKALAFRFSSSIGESGFFNGKNYEWISLETNIWRVVVVVMVFLIYEMVPESYFLNTFENTLRSISGNFKVSFESRKKGLFQTWKGTVKIDSTSNCILLPLRLCINVFSQEHTTLLHTQDE